VKFKFISESRRIGIVTVKRIQYEDGTIGGYLEHKRNLNETSNAKVLDMACVVGNAVVTDDAVVSQYACITGDAFIYDNAKVYGQAIVKDLSRVFGSSQVFDNAYISHNSEISGDAVICGNAYVCGHSYITGGTWELSPLSIHGTRFHFNVSGPRSIAIGCRNKTVEKWLDTYQKEFYERNFSFKEQLEYIRYFNLASKMYNWDIEIPEPSEF
jgi:carbonic anhydrase/acetyltransferase-like protein (isoleucine patch superfamily)